MKKNRITIYIRNSMYSMVYREFVARKCSNDSLTITKFLQQIILEYLIIRDLIKSEPELQTKIGHELMKWSVKNDF